MVDENYLSVAEAAALLRVSKSTLWRWIEQGDLPAYRLGHRRVLIKRQDLGYLISPARALNPTIEAERSRLTRPLTATDQSRALAALAAAEQFATNLRTSYGEQLFEDSAETLRELREERTRQLP